MKPNSRSVRRAQRLLVAALLTSLGCGDAQPDAAMDEPEPTRDANVDRASDPDSMGGSGRAESGDAAIVRPMGRTDGGAAVRDATAPGARDAASGEARDGGASSGTAADSGVGALADAGSSPAACDRACLIDFNTKYLEALVANDARKLPTAGNVRFTENGKELPLTAGLWSVAKSLRDYRQDFAEVPAGQTAGFVVLDDDKGVVLLAFRLRVIDRAVSEIETTLCRQGQATFFSPDNLTKRDPVYDMEVAPAERLPREKLIELVDLYFQALESGDGSKIPFHGSASRNENGAITASGSRISSVAQFSYIDRIERRYALVDEERGNVLPWVLFQIPMGLGGARTLHLAELFKVSGGKILKIHAVMVNQPLGTPSGWE